MRFMHHAKVKGIRLSLVHMLAFYHSCMLFRYFHMYIKAYWKYLECWKSGKMMQLLVIFCYSQYTTFLTEAFYHSKMFLWIPKAEIHSIGLQYSKHFPAIFIGIWNVRTWNTRILDSLLFSKKGTKIGFILPSVQSIVLSVISYITIWNYMQNPS